MHLVLATQRPAGVVNENITANTNVRIALRVQDGTPADVTLHAVSYSFPNGRTAIDGLNLHLDSGDRCAITGPSGKCRKQMLKARETDARTDSLIKNGWEKPVMTVRFSLDQ